MSRRHVMLRRGILAALAVVAQAAEAGDWSDAKENCALEYPGNGEMIYLCAEHHLNAKKALRKLERKPQNRAIVSGCKRANPGAIRGTDWASALDCVRYELKEARRK